MNMRIVLLAALALAACGSQPAAEPPLAGASIGGPFALTDQNGRAFTDRNLKGQYRLMYFGYTFCPDVCPTDVQTITGGLKLIEKEDPALGAKITPVFVTVDPERDTPPAVKQFTANFHPRMIGLTGSPAAIEAVKKEYGVFSSKGEPSPGGGYMVSHSNQAYLMSPDGKPLALLEQENGAKAVADVIRRWAT